MKNYYWFAFTCRWTGRFSSWQHNTHFLSLQLLRSDSVHSPVPTWGHLSQLGPQALPTVQQHVSWVRWGGSACSQPLASDAIRKHRACSAGDSEMGDNGVAFGGEDPNSESEFYIIQTPRWRLTHQHIDSCPTPNRPCRNIWSCPACSDSLRSDRHLAWSTRWYLRGREVGCENEKVILMHCIGRHLIRKQAVPELYHKGSAQSFSR